MPSYYLHLHQCGETFLADEPIERADLTAVRIAAVEGARDIIRSEVGEGRLCLSCRIEVEDHLGATVLVVPFSEAVTVRSI